MEAKSFNNVGEAALSLACLSMEKQAVRRVTEKQAKDDWMQNLVAWAKENPELAGSLVGLGGGGLFGALSSIGRPEEERDTLGSAITGGLAGGLLGLGGGLAYRNTPAIKKMFTGGAEPTAESWQDAITRGIESGDLPSLRDPNTPLTMRETITGEHGMTPAEALDLENKLKGMTLSQAQDALASGDITPGQYRTFLEGQHVVDSGPDTPGALARFFGTADLPHGGKFQPRTYADDPTTAGLSDTQLRGRMKAHESEMQDAFNENMPMAYDIPTAVGMGGIDLAQSQLRHRFFNPRNVEHARSGAESLQAQQPQGGDVTKLRDAFGKAKQPQFDPKGKRLPTDTKAVQQASQNLSNAQLYEWMKNQGTKAQLQEAMREAHKMRPGVGVDRVMRHAYPHFYDTAGKIKPQYQAEFPQTQRRVMENITRSTSQGRSNLGGYRSTWSSLWGGPQPAKDTPGALGNTSRFNRAGPRNLLRAGLYLGLPMAVGRFRQQNYRYDPANYTPEKLLGRP